MTAIKKTIFLMMLTVVLLVPAAASAEPPPSMEAAYFAQINGIVSRNMEEILPREQWPAEATRVMVLVQINEDGTIGYSELALKSEHEFMNQALMAALEKSQPLPTLPEELQPESESGAEPGLRLMALMFNFDKNASPQPATSPAPAEAASPSVVQAPEKAE